MAGVRFCVFMGPKNASLASFFEQLRRQQTNENQAKCEAHLSAENTKYIYIGMNVSISYKYVYTYMRYSAAVNYLLVSGP